MKKLIDNMDKFRIMMRCHDEGRTNFARALARKEWGKIGEAHFSLQHSITTKMTSLNNELKEKR